MRIIRYTLLFTLLAAPAFGADVYRTTAADGTVSYSDRPQSDSSEFVFVNTPRPGGPATAAQRQARPPAAPAPAADAPPEAPATPALPPGPTAAQLREQRQKNCDIARERQERYTISRRLFRTTANGEREYLSDQQIDEARAKAAADVEDWCS